MLISIITPSYNLARYLPLTIRSILSQAGDFELEYIVIDGGSVDSTVEILKKYESDLTSGRIKPVCRGINFIWISEKDSGQANAINKGLRIANGEVVAYLNADDLLAEGCLQTVKEYFECHPEQKLLTGYCRIIDERGNEIRKAITWYKKILMRFPYFNNLLKENFISQPATFWRRELHNEIGYFNEHLSYALDYDMWCRIAFKYRINVLKKHLADFRWYNDSKSGKNYGLQFSEQFGIAKKYIGHKPFLRLVHWLNWQKTVTVYRLLT